MKQELLKLAHEYGNEYTRTTGKIGNISYNHGWFDIGCSKVRRAELEKLIATLKTRPTVTDRMEMVNGVSTLVKAHQHVVKSLIPPHADVIEDRDTPWTCSVASETYWST